jgi:hypothetical protein
VFWGSRTENGGDFKPDYSDRQIGATNQFLDRMYQHISADLPSEQFLRFDRGLMTGSVTHKWGIGPFHYIDAYYHAAIQQLCVGPSSRSRAAISEETMTSRASYSIDKVTLRHECDDLVATVVFNAPQEGQFAFYLFRNGKRIHARVYSPNPTVRIGIKSEPGLYRVLVFFLARHGARTTKYSNPVFLYPIVSVLAG